MRTCKWCQAEITSTNPKKVFCNDKCKNDYGNNKRKELRKNNKHYCIVCGSLIENYTPNQKFCSDKCHEKHLIDVHNERFGDGDCCICEICGFKAKSLVSHLKDKHTLSLNDYMIKYNKTLNECILQSVRDTYGSKGDKNPAYQHGGKLSPYSKNFIKYEDMSDEEKENKINNMYNHLSETLTDGTGRLPTQIEYWTKQGFTEEEAVEKISERQTTFSLDICIKKYGEIEGKQIWKERQDKWLDSFPKQNFSLVSQTLFWKIYNNIKNKYKNIYFAQLNQKTKMLEEHKNYEYKLDIGKSYCKLDFFIKDINKCIEFDGDYWHGEKRGNQERDKIRTKLIEEAGIKVLHVKERDYKNNPQKMIQECLNFLCK